MLRTRHPRSTTARSLVLRTLVVPVTVVMLAACGSSGESSSAEGDTKLTVPESEWVDETGKGSVTVITKDNTFTPKYMKVSPGTKIVFDNRGRTAHNVIPSNKDQFESIPVDDLQPADTATLVFDDPGEYPYYCSLHGTPTKGMIGAVLVEG
ncbi:MAG: cupredoxin domain-containing protein [Actinomycetota bacterium]|jgi:plastocyanin|nr:cupredoxin domain-containing protein [Actinomycetota bacterium]